MRQGGFLNEFLQELHFLFKKFSNVQNKTVNGKSGVGGVWMDCIKQGE